jgi:carbamoyl-phosphate synthase large subunit
MKKLMVTGKGAALAGVTVEDPGLVEETRRLVQALRWDGAIEAEFIRDVDGRAWCFEVNPCFPSWIALATEAGANLPATLVRLVGGEAFESSRAKPGRMFARVVVERVFDHGNPLAHLGRTLVSTGALADPCQPRRRGVGPVVKSGTVAITGLNAADNPSPGLTVARALRTLAAPPRLIGLAHEMLATAAYVGGIWEEVRLLPFPTLEEGDYAGSLLTHCRDAGVDCLIPTLDIEVPIVATLTSRLAAAGVATLVPPLEVLAAIAKSQLPRLTARGFRVPRTELLAGLHDIPRAGRALGWPFILKGSHADARIVRSDEEARVTATRLAAIWGFPVIAQTFVEGEEFGVAAVADRRHRVLGTVVVRKEIQTLNGNTWGGVAANDRTLRALAARFAEALGWVGPFELEIIRDPRRGPFLIEVNPRFPAWVYLSAGAGANLPWTAVCLARGERAPALAPRAGAFYVRMAWDATAPMERMAMLSVDRKVGRHVG